jgi:uncharacterized cofD-like protein
MKKITVIGGGTGSFTILSGLKKLTDVELTAIVPSTDSGGSTGRLRDEFGYLPIGDIRQCLAALAESDEEQDILRKLFLYRFDKGEIGLKGHNLGNLLLTALRDILGSDVEAIQMAQELFNIKGNIYPVSLENTTLVAEYENGEVLKGEHNIDEPHFPHDGRLRIKNLYTEPHVNTYQEVRDAINESDFIVIGPGDLYTSLFANLVIDGLKNLICGSNAKVVYVLNLVTKFGQTYNFTASDFLHEVEKYLGKAPDYTLINSSGLPSEILDRYKMENAIPVINDLDGEKYNVIETDLLAGEEIVKPNGDILRRSLIRHDGEKVAQVIHKLLMQS